jgi:hypothetical protein
VCVSHDGHGAQRSWCVRLVSTVGRCQRLQAAQASPLVAHAAAAHAAAAAGAAAPLLLLPPCAACERRASPGRAGTA